MTQNVPPWYHIAGTSTETWTQNPCVSLHSLPWCISETSFLIHLKTQGALVASYKFEILIKCVLWTDPLKTKQKVRPVLHKVAKRGRWCIRHQRPQRGTLQNTKRRLKTWDCVWVKNNEAAVENVIICFWTQRARLRPREAACVCCSGWKLERHVRVRAAGGAAHRAFSPASSTTICSCSTIFLYSKWNAVLTFPHTVCCGSTSAVFSQCWSNLHLSTHSHTHNRDSVEEFTRGRYQSFTYLPHLFHAKFTVRQHLWMTMAGRPAGGLSMSWIKCDLEAAVKTTLHKSR